LPSSGISSRYVDNISSIDQLKPATRSDSRCRRSGMRVVRTPNITAAQIRRHSIFRFELEVKRSGQAWSGSQPNESCVSLRIQCRTIVIDEWFDRIRSGAEITLRRFWKTVHIKEESTGASPSLSFYTSVSNARPGEYQITLDHRTLKTPAGSRLVLPKERRLIAMLIANEWENQDEVLKQHALPLVGSRYKHNPMRRS